MKVTVSKVDEVFMHVDCDDGLAKDLHDFFSFKVPGAKFMPSYKNKWWDGKVYLFSIKTHKIYIGLLPYVDEFCRERGFEFEGVADILGTKTREKVSQSWLADLKLPFEPRDYQIDALNETIQYGRQLLLSPTASGKSLIIYLLARYYDKKTIIIVPTTSLVEQMTKDFEEYGYDKDVCKIYSGQPVFPADITISTWQSFAKAPKEVLQGFDVVVGDEAHLFKAQTLKGILEKMKTTAIRIGTTGTLDGSEVHRLQLEGLFGPVKKVITTKELMDSGTIANLSIECVILRHTKQKKMSYQDEMDYLVSNQQRNLFITNLVGSLRGNTLVLFQYIEKHGQPLWELFNPMVSRMNGTLHYVHGGTDTEDREMVREIVDNPKKKNNVILASYGTFSTGVNIKKIDNVVFASPSKSRIRNLQSIGRGLRKADGKTEMRLFDISDDLQCNNHTLNHLKERINIYNEENFTYEIRQFDLK
ncbi:DEAD/DEAH box helicase family protein [bacterium]|jgi:superfamily II DNA or RNA helicase|nr:DEAD/DEAH box helicase family protein [bacterium]